MNRRTFVTLTGGRDTMIEKAVRVSVRGEPHDVNLYQKSKSVWVATGEVRSTPIQAKGRDESSAVKLWRKMAEYWRS